MQSEQARSGDAGVLTFYQFLGSHSLLIGLLPFYLPVFLWGQGYRLAEISALIGISGLSFCVALTAWQWAARKLRPATLFSITFALECALVLCALVLEQHAALIVALGIVNGLYNGFFWTTQRTLFLNILGDNDAGRQYGNFQIFVTVFLKFGILLGGVLLDAGGMLWILLLSVLIASASAAWFHLRLDASPINDSTAVSLRQSFRYNDRHRSRMVFMIDGFFLFLESHFWTLSLFLLAREDYTRLGIIVVVLAVLFAVLFFILKNTIDRIAGAALFQVAVVLYALSWLARVFVDDPLGVHVLLVLLTAITFCSTFFRLAFNKRFFDIALRAGRTRYLLVKSYLSQCLLGCGFLLGAWLFPGNLASLQSTFLWIYCAAGVAALLYLAYDDKPGQQHR